MNDRELTEQKRLDDLREEVIEMTTHELRTPLTAIHAALHLMLSGDFGPLPEAHKKFAEMAYANCERMTRMINDFLDMQKIESGRSQFKMLPIEIVPLVEAAILANSSYAGRFAVSFSFKKPEARLWVSGDADALIQVLTNLLSNAAKYSPSNASVDVEVARRGAMIRVSVADHGPGIPQEFRDRIFQRFAQIGGTDPRKKGSGLGLRIAKDIVERLGGAIGFDTKDGQGSTFHFELPEARGNGAHD